MTMASLGAAIFGIIKISEDYNFNDQMRKLSTMSIISKNSSLRLKRVSACLFIPLSSSRLGSLFRVKTSERRSGDSMIDDLESGASELALFGRFSSRTWSCFRG